MKAYIDITDKRWNEYNIDTDKIISKIDIAHNKNAELSIVFTNDAEIRKLNKKYRGFDKPTNVLSFEMGDDELLGDVYISIDTVIREAAEQNKTIENHTIHLIVHGALHLLGFDHLDDKDANKMETAEIKILKKLNIKNPYKEKNKDWMRILILAVCGGFASLGFAPYNMWFLSLIGIGGAYYLTVKDDDKNSVYKSFVKIMPFASIYALSMFWWMLNSIYVIPELAAQFAIWTIPSLIGIAFFGGIIFSTPFVLMARARRFLPGSSILFAFFWTFVLWLREWLLTGFPWNPFANISLPCPLLSNSMSMWGALGLSFVLIGLIASVVDLIMKRNRQNKITFVIFLSLIVIGVFVGHANIEKSNTASPEEKISVRIVQPSFSAEDKESHLPQHLRQSSERNVQKLISMSNSDDKKFDLIVFPETTYPYVVTDDYLPMAKILNTTIITGATSYKNGHLYNSMIVADKNGHIEKIYNKSHLVPFGEYRPFGDIIPTPGQLSSGVGPEIIELKLDDDISFNFAPAICYEIVFTDSLIPKNSNKTPQVIINITNDIWFGKTQGSFQHLDMVRRYAIESGLPIVRANFSGISAFVSSNGEIMAQLPIGAIGVLDGEIGQGHNTIYRSIGRDLMMLIIFAFSSILIYVFYCVRKSYKS